ncbi:MATE family efflux transporter [Agrobacterium sp. NPDC090273]|uniref:MATE family efflux transporter n=1 Tax=Agrobacterium sp. NPDC090273 TaxID=3363919 RepID=UPI00383B3DB8
MSSSVMTESVRSGTGSWFSHFRATLALGIPLIGAQLAQLGIHTTDMVIVGQLGAEKLAAMVLAGQFYFVVFIFGSGFSVAVVPMVAQAYGQGDATAARRSLRMGMWVAIAYWFLSLPIFFNAERILIALGQNPAVAALTGHYLAIAQFALLPALLFYVLRGLVSAIGRAGIILYVTIIMLVINGVVAYALVLGHFGLPALGMNGAAVVAVIVNAFSFIFIVGYVQTRDETRQYELFVRFWRPDWHALWEVLRLGLPISITILAEVTLFAAASILMGQIGTVELAAHGIALQLASIAFMIPLGLSQAATVRVGIARGQRDYTALVRAAVTVYVIACAIALCGGILFAMAPQFLAQWFLDAKLPEAPEVLAYASGLVVIAGVFQLVDGIQAVAAGLLRGLKDARIPAMLALVSYWPIGLALAWTMAFPFGLGGRGIWFGFLIGLSTAAILLTIRFVILVKHEMKTAR